MTEQKKEEIEDKSRAKKFARLMLDKPNRTNYRNALEAGYSDSTARDASRKIMTSKTLHQALADVISNREIAEKQKQLQNACMPKTIYFSEDTTDEDIREVVEAGGGMLIKISQKFNRRGRPALVLVPDTQIQKSALDMLYKLKGAYAPERHINASLSELQTMPQQDLDEIIAHEEAFFNKKEHKQT